MPIEKKPQPRILAARMGGIVVAVVLIAGATGYAMNVRRTASEAGSARSRSETVAAITDAMNRSDAAGVLKHLDLESLSNNLMRHLAEVDLKRPLTDEEFKSMASSKVAQFVPQMKDGIVHGVTTQEDKDGATSGSLLGALVHLSEGRIETVDDGHFDVVFADGSSLKFGRKDGVWVAVELTGYDARIAEYQKAAADVVSTSKKAAARKTQDVNAAGAGSGN